MSYTKERKAKEEEKEKKEEEKGNRVVAEESDSPAGEEDSSSGEEYGFTRQVKAMKKKKIKKPTKEATEAKEKTESTMKANNSLKAAENFANEEERSPSFAAADLPKPNSHSLDRVQTSGLDIVAVNVHDPILTPCTMQPCMLIA